MVRSTINTIKEGVLTFLSAFVSFPKYLAKILLYRTSNTQANEVEESNSAIDNTEKKFHQSRDDSHLPNEVYLLNKNSYKLVNDTLANTKIGFSKSKDDSHLDLSLINLKKLESCKNKTEKNLKRSVIGEEINDHSKLKEQNSLSFYKNNLF
ncbi:hypothetical protein Lgra_0207 [Legionella gratiana]|uniref:Uncharacterized protein n=1 Tax=Legionella gratiana TaxID=45066 RepID=A0A378JBY4_9GAMM|nr:hypothetical protein [Legionella gratiana]KTD15541.1 hypothetical protein Lgra_0207 [Legionella gratiana]STX45115.1 Uncharacterised protein [Legionella gratiana]